MPQPLSSRGVTTVSPGDITIERPELAAAALRIIAAASDADLALSRALVFMSPANLKSLVAHYALLDSDNRKRTTIDAIAATHLTPELKALLDRILAKNKAMQKKRTPFAHWIYASTRERTDLLILINPEDQLRAEPDQAFMNHYWLYEDKIPASSPEAIAMLATYEPARAAVIASAYSYDIDELNQISEQFRVLTECFEMFWRIANWKGAQRQEARRALSQQLEQNLQRLG